MAVLLSRRIRSLEAFPDNGNNGCGVIFDESHAICFCLLYFHSGGRAKFSVIAGMANSLGVSFFSGSGSGSGWFFSSSAFLPAAADCSSSWFLHKMGSIGIRL